jgi:hypothetical protein
LVYQELEIMRSKTNQFIIHPQLDTDFAWAEAIGVLDSAMKASIMSTVKLARELQTSSPGPHMLNP